MLSGSTGFHDSFCVNYFSHMLYVLLYSTCCLVSWSVLQFSGNLWLFNICIARSNACHEEWENNEQSVYERWGKHGGMLKIWIRHIRIQLTGVTRSVASVRPWTQRSWLLLMVFCCFMNSPALDFQSLSHSPNPSSSVAWGLSLMCMPVLFPGPVRPAWKAPHSCQKDISKNTKGELCQDRHFYACLCWVSLATTAGFSPCPCWGNLFWDQECAQPCSLPFPPSSWASWGEQQLQPLFGGSPIEPPIEDPWQMVWVGVHGCISHWGCLGNCLCLSRTWVTLPWHSWEHC